MRKPGFPLRRLVWLGLALGAVTLYFLVFREFPLQRQFNLANDWARGVMVAHPNLGMLVFLFFSALSAMLAFASSTVLVPPAISAWGELITFLLLWGGWMAGAVAAYGIGHLALPLLVRLGYEKKLAQYQQVISERIHFWAVLLFCFAVPSEIPGYLLGGMRYPFGKFMAAIAMVEAAYALGVIVAGEKFIASEFSIFLLILGILLLITVGSGLLFRKFK